MITAACPFELARLPLAALNSLECTFGRLPSDPYADKGLRSRRYSRYRYHADGMLERLNHKDFMQSKAINKFVGDVERRYEEIEDCLSHDPVFLKMFEEFRAHTALDESAVIEAHQIRWHCDGRPRDPAPEGMHQDGFDFIAMFAVDTFNAEGGEILLYDFSKGAASPCFKKRLENGEFVVLNDRALFHNAAPLTRARDGEDGHWDLIVLTANRP